MVTTLKQGASKKYIQELFNTILKKVSSEGVDTQKYCGKIKIKDDALKIQKGLRNEWE